METVGCILAGGQGTRLQPITNYINKHLLHIYNKPMIYYSLSVLFLAKIKDIMIISSKKDIKNFKLLLGDGSIFFEFLDISHLRYYYR